MLKVKVEMTTKVAMKKTAKEIADGQGLAGAGVIDWKLGGTIFASDIDRMADGILFCLKRLGRKRWPAWEKKLLRYATRSNNSPTLAMQYARQIVRQRWPELESVLIPNWPCLVDYLKWEGFKKGTGSLEHLMFTSRKHDFADLAHTALQYAMIVRKSRWEEGEAVILKATAVSKNAYGVSQVAEAYRKQYFPRRAWSDLNDRIRRGRCTPTFMIEYLKHSGTNCSSAVKEGLLKTSPKAEDFTQALWTYADEVLGAKLPDDLHARMLLKSFETPNDPFVRQYCHAYP